MYQLQRLFFGLLILTSFAVPITSMADDAQDKPVIEFIGNREVAVAGFLGIDVYAFSSRPGVPWLWVENLPRGASFFDRGEGFRTFLWSPGADQVGEHTMTFIAADANDQSIQSEQQITVTVLPGEFTSPAFSIIAPSNVDALVGQTLSVRVLATDSDGSVPSLTGVIMPATATLDDNGDGSRTFRWTPTKDDIGDHLVRFDARPANFPNWSTSHDLVVRVLAQAPLISFPVAPGVVAGDTFNFPVSVTKPSGAVPWLTIDNLPGTASFHDNGDGSRQFVWQTTESDIGSHEFALIATDPLTGLSSSIQMFLSVLPRPGDGVADQTIMVHGPIQSLDLSNAEFDQAVDISIDIINAKVGFLAANVDLMLNGQFVQELKLRPGTNTVFLDVANTSRRIVLNIFRVTYLDRAYPALQASGIAVDVDAATIALGSRFYELDGTQVISSQQLADIAGVNYVTSVDISNSKAVLASRDRPQDGVWLYKRVAGRWVFDTHLQPEPDHAPQGMGSVAVLDDSTLAVSAIYYAGSTNDTPGAGAVLIYEHDGNDWIYTTTLTANHSDRNDYFGHSLSLEGDTLVVGAIGEDSSTAGVNGDPLNNDYQVSETTLHSAGAAYVFERNNGVWEQSAYLKPASNAIGNIAFGHTVAVFGDTIAVSALEAVRDIDENKVIQNLQAGERIDVYQTGSVYVFEKNSTTWAQTQKLDAPSDIWRFGLDIDVKKNQILVLSQTHAFFYERADNNWRQLWNEDVGASVAAFNDKAMVFASHGYRAIVFGNDFRY